METKIKKTLTNWLPDVFVSFTNIENATDYDVLNYFAQSTINLINQNNSERCRVHFNFINILYSKGTLYDKNAIENEFLAVVANCEKTTLLKIHIDLMPQSLRAVYLKTILEN